MNRRERTIEDLVAAPLPAHTDTALGPGEPADAFRARMIERGLELLVEEVMAENVAKGWARRVADVDGKPAWEWTDAGRAAIASGDYAEAGT